MALCRSGLDRDVGTNGLPAMIRWLGTAEDQEVGVTERHSHRIVATARGGPEVLELIEEELPEPAAGEVRVRVVAAGVSGFDLLTRSLSMPGNPTPPFTPGEDVAGVVDAVGEDVDGLDVGQRVAGWMLAGQGGYAEYVCWPAERLVPVPEGVDPAVAVAVVVNYLTAHLYLHETAEVKRGEQILVHGAAGGLGSALVQLGRLAGLEIYGTASAHNQAVVSSLGATPIDYRAEDFVERIHELTGDGVDVVFDTVGGARQLWRSSRALRKGGRLIPLGSAGISTGGRKVIALGLLAIVALKLVPDGRRVLLSSNMTKYPQADPGWYRRTLIELLGLAADGTIEPLISERIPLAEAARAHDLLATGHHAGKVVLVPEAEAYAATDRSWV